MITFLDPFGYHISGKSLGEVWLELVALVVKKGKVSYDETRRRVAVQSIRFKSLQQKIPDRLIKKYGDKKNLDAMVRMTFVQEKMVDVDVLPSFSPGADSYYSRLKKGQLVEFVVKRLSGIPESKKAVIVFPVRQDYRRILARPKDDYLPCVVAIQFRLNKTKKGYALDSLTYLRSLDVYQKAYGNFVAIAMLGHKIAKKISKNLNVPVTPRYLDGFVADAHIYQETIEDAGRLVREVKRQRRMGSGRRLR